LTGRAADIHVQDMTPQALAQYIQARGFAVDKTILEFGSWVHVQVSEKPEIEPRRKFLTARHTEQGTQYIEGLA
jgi:hypothetical protein